MLILLFFKGFAVGLGVGVNRIANHYDLLSRQLVQSQNWRNAGCHVLFLGQLLTFQEFACKLDTCKVAKAAIATMLDAKNTSAEAYLQLNVASRAANRAALMWSALATYSSMFEAFSVAHSIYQTLLLILTSDVYLKI